MEILLSTFSAENIYLEYASYSLYCLKACVSKEALPVNISIKCYNCSVSIQEQETQNKEIIDFIRDRHVKIAGFGCYIWNMKRILSLASMIKDLFPDIKIIFGGPQVIYKPEELLSNHPFIDLLVRGEGEEIFADFVRYSVYPGRKMEDIPGIIFRRDGEIISNPSKEILTELDLIPSPYLTGLYRIKKGYVYPVETTRGCVFACDYCHWGMTKLRFFSLERVKKEIDYLLTNMTSISMFVDSAVNFDKKRAMEIIKFINHHNKGTLVTMFQSIHFLDDEFIELLNRSPGIYSEIGIQSLNPLALRNINRRIIKKEEFLRLNFMKRPFTIDLIYGLPGDNLHFFKKTFEEVFRYTNNISMFRLGVHPGTKLWEKQEEYKMEINEDYSIISNYSYSKSEIDQTEKFKKNYEELFTPVICSEFSWEEISSIADSLKLFVFDFINNYSIYLKKNFSCEYINTIKHSGREVKLQSLREFSIDHGGGVF
jgi:radical SAM superfamily enzyme YgiQ (UPF0313 family)